MAEGYTPVAQRPSSEGSDTVKSASDLTNKTNNDLDQPSAPPPHSPNSYNLGSLFNPVTASTDHPDKRVVESNYALDAPMLAVDDREEHEKIMWKTPTEGPERVTYKPNRDGAALAVNDVSSDAEKGPSTPGPAPKTICGIPRKKFAIICAVLGIIIIAAAIGVGVSQGIKSKANDTTQNNINNGTRNNTQGGVAKGAKHAPVLVSANTGIASAASTDGKFMYTYHRAPNGSMIESKYADGTVTAAGMKQGGPVAEYTSSIDNINMDPKSPIAAIAYKLNGLAWRHIFYISDAGLVQEIKTSGTAWTTPSNVSTMTVAKGSQCLAACYGPIQEHIGVRVIAGFSNYAIGERYSYMSVPGYDGWNTGLKLSGSSITAGCACSVELEYSTPLLHIYSRSNSAAGDVLHYAHYFDENATAEPWLVEENDLSYDTSMSMADDSSMTVTNGPDPFTDWLFYQGRDGKMKQFLANTSGLLTSSNVFKSWDAHPFDGSKIAVTWLDSSPEGPLVLYQTTSDQITASVINYNGVAVANNTLMES